MFIRSAVLAGLLFSIGAPAQQPPASAPAQTAPGTTFRTETRLVPVDVVVQDKKGNYIRDLEQKDFKILEDNKEQQIKSFSFEADPASPLAQQKKYLVLFFDLSSMNMPDQQQARQAAAKFVDANAGPNRLMAVAHFGGSLEIAQNFTEDIERLKAVVNAPRFAAVSTAGATASGGRGLGGMQRFGMRTMVMALRNLANRLADIPGRKSVVLFSAGFPLSQEIQSEITAAVDVCNRANVAVYPVDVRGLTTNFMPFDPRRGAATTPGALRDSGLALAPMTLFRIAALFAPQRGGGTPGGAGGTAGASPSAGAPSGGASNAPAGTPRGGGGSPSGGMDSGGGIRRAPGVGSAGGMTGRDGMGGNNPAGGGGRDPGFGRGGMENRQPNQRNLDVFNTRQIVPRFPESATTNQQALYMLAEGTGGFVIANTNDLLGGLQKIGKEQNEYYLMAYAPPESPEGSCHTIRVKVSRGGTNVRARSGYCNAKRVDLLSGKPVEKELETMATGSQAPTIQAAPMQVPFFYTAANTARVFVTMEIPTASVKFEKVKGKQHAEIHVLGIAYRKDGNVAARFSDSVKRDFEEKKQVEDFLKKPLRYENQFDLGSGEYTLKVAFTSAGAGFGKLETPLKIEPYNPAHFQTSAIAFSANYHPVTLETNLDSQLVEGKTPLMVGQLQFEPAGAARFKKTDRVGVYFEVYEPLLLQDPPPAQPVQLGAQMRILDSKTGQLKLDTGGVALTKYAKAGNPVVPVGLKLPVNELAAGSYSVELKTVDSAGWTWTRIANFELQ